MHAMLRASLILAVLVGAASIARAQEVSVEAPGVDFETFQAPLSEHGEWIEVGDYGRVWRPWRVESDWRPYYRGHWAWSDDGWFWASDEPWGWATYHYGRWSWEPGWGWIWIPGYEWAPAWVDWRYNDGVIGWAPMYPVGGVVRPVVYEHWTFVPCHSFVGVSAHTVAFAPAQVRATWGSTTHLPGAVHQAAPIRGGGAGGGAGGGFAGPPRAFVEQRVGHPVETIHPVRVDPSSQLHRPPLSTSPARPAPTSAPHPVESQHVLPVRPAPQAQHVVGASTPSVRPSPQVARPMDRPAPAPIHSAGVQPHPVAAAPAPVPVPHPSSSSNAKHH